MQPWNSCPLHSDGCFTTGRAAAHKYAGWNLLRCGAQELLYHRQKKRAISLFIL